MRSHALVSLALCFWCGSAPALAHPDLARARAAGPLTLYPDDRRSDLFYYGPGEIVLATDAAGRPDLHLLQMRYTGTAAGGDQGSLRFRSLLSLRVVHGGSAPEDLSAARATLGGGRRAELRPLPIQRLEAALVYAPLNPQAAEVAATPLPGGHFEAAGEGSEPGQAGYWTERTFTLALGPEEAQIFWETLQRGQIALSLGYAFVARGKGAAPQVDLAGGAVLGGELRHRLDAAVAEPDEREELRESVVRAGATSIVVDAGRWPALLKRVDINERLPPGYAALSVYCYDFNNALRPDLYEKQVEIEARSVADGTVTMSAAFRASEADVYARSLRFPVAVRLDRPYRYRVSEVGLDGAVKEGGWLESETWSRILDVTSPEAAKEESDDAPDS